LEISKAVRRFSVCALLLVITSATLGQSEKGEDVPQKQRPVHEREHSDSFIEILGKLPGKIITFPIKLVFEGASAAAELIDYHHLYLRATDLLTSEDGNTKVRPIFSPVGGGGFLFGKDKFAGKGSSLRTSATFGIRTRRQIHGGLRFPRLFTRNIGLTISGSHSRLPDEDFFGLGRNSKEADETNYQHEENNARLGFLFTATEKSWFGLTGTYENVKIQPGRDSRTPSIEETFTGKDIPGLSGAEMFSFMFHYYRDSRNSIGQPTAGSQILAAYSLSFENGGSDFGFQKITFDVKKYFELFYTRTLAVGFRGEITENLADREVPFYNLGGLGGNLLRGFRPVRFRDNDLVLAGLEYRFPIHALIDIFVFGEEGQVFKDIFQDFSISDFKSSYGFGVRFHSRSGTVTGIEFAKSNEQFKINFGLNTDLRRF